MLLVGKKKRMQLVRQGRLVSSYSTQKISVLHELEIISTVLLAAMYEMNMERYSCYVQKRHISFRRGNTFISSC